MMRILLSAPVAHNLEPSDHLPDGEKADDFSKNDASACECLSIQISDPSEEGLWVVHRVFRGALCTLLRSGHDGRWVPEGILDGGEVRLNGLHGSGLVSQGRGKMIERSLRRSHAPACVDYPP